MSSETKIVEIRGNMIAMMSIVLYSSDLDLVRNALTNKVQQAPAFFVNTPVVVDFSQIPIDFNFDFNSLFKIVRQRKLLPVAVRGVPKNLQEKMQQAGVPVVDQAGVAIDASSNGSTRAKKPKSGQALIVDGPEQVSEEVFAEDGDLILLTSSDATAELVADGNIHVYGVMRGRALCGAHGNTNARIFCRSLQADIVSVAGHSKDLADLPDNLKNCPIQIRLHNEEVLIEPIDGTP